MTPLAIEEAARNKYNSVGDTFYSTDEIMDLIYEACLILANETQCIEQTYTTTSVASQQEYSYPTNAIAIKRITYAGRKLEPINFRQDDILTLNNSSSSDTGNPQYYAIWNETLYLRPIPASSSETIKIFSYNEPAAVTSSSTLEIPSQFHMDIVNFVVSEMCAKDENQKMAQYYERKWLEGVSRVKRFMRKKQRGDSYAAVMDEESMQTTLLGYV